MQWGHQTQPFRWTSKTPRNDLNVNNPHTGNLTTENVQNNKKILNARYNFIKNKSK